MFIICTLCLHILYVCLVVCYTVKCCLKEVVICENCLLFMTLDTYGTSDVTFDTEVSFYQDTSASSWKFCKCHLCESVAELTSQLHVIFSSYTKAASCRYTCMFSIDTSVYVLIRNHKLCPTHPTELHQMLQKQMQKSNFMNFKIYSLY